MKKRVLSMLLALCLLIGLQPVMPVFAADGDIPETLYLAVSTASNIPSRIDLYPDPSGAQNQYHMYLPGNAVPSACFLSWEGGLTATLNGKGYASGTLPIPAPGETETVTFTRGSTTKTFNIVTYQGSASVHPIFFELDESQGTIAAMLENKNNTCTGTVIIDGIAHNLDTIKGRGNATWRDDKEKKPFNFKLDKATEKKLSLSWIDCEKTRKWTLLSNVNDRTLLRNKVAYDLAHQMGIGFDSAPVDIWLNGSYWGTYQLTPKTDAYVSDDGYLLEDNNIVDDEDPSFNTGGMIINIKEIGDNLIIAEGGNPDDETSQATKSAIQANKSKIQSYFSDVYNAMNASSGTNSKGVYYADYFDMDSMASFYLLHEFIKNLEVDGGSIFLTRNGTADTDKLIAGPAWDYDNSMGYNGSNGSMAAGGSGWPRNAPLNYASLSVGNWYITGRNRGKLFGTLSKHQDFLDKTYEVYNRYYALFDDVNQNVRRQAALIEDSARMNFIRTVKEDKNNFDFPQHNTTFDEGTAYEVNYKEAQVWEEYVDNLVTFTSGRAQFFHDQMYVENTCDHDYQAVVTAPTCTEGGYTTYTCTKCGESYVDDEIPALGHDFVNGVCTRCGTQVMKVTFYCDEGVSITTYDKQDLTGAHENAVEAYPRDSASGLVDVSGNGQVNFVVNIANGYKLDSITADPPTNYKNFKLPEETQVPNCYRLTKVAGNVNIIVKVIEVGPCEHEYTAVETPATCTAQGFTTCTCSKCGDSYISGYTPKIPHNYVGGVCTVCGEKLINVTISCGEGASVTVLETQKADGPNTENATKANPRDGDSGLIDCSGEGQVNFIVKLANGYELESVTAEPAGSYKNLKGPADTAIENGYRITKVTGDFTITVTAKKAGGDPTVPKATFVCDEGASITTYDTQDMLGEAHENATEAYPRDSVSGEIDATGSGQVNFVVNIANGYKLDSITAEPASNYKNFKLPDETLVNNGYRITKMTGNVTVTVKVTETGPCEHDYKAEVTQPTCTAQGFTTYTCSKCGESYVGDYTAKIPHNYVNGTCTVCGEKLVNVTISCSEGASVTVLETQKADGPAAENAAKANPRDGDSGLIDCSGEGQVNFIVKLADGYLLESVIAEPAASYKNLKGPEDTGIENGYRITKVKGDFTITVTARKNGDPVCEHEFRTDVTAPTCTEKGYTTYTCTKCGYTYTGDETAALGHDFQNGVCTRCGQKEDLPPVVNKDELDKAIADAEKVEKEKYTDETVAALDTAVAAAKAVQAADDASQDAVDAAVMAVRDAIKALKEKPVVDKTELYLLTEPAERLKEEDFTPESFAPFKTVLETARNVQENPNATQAEVDTAVKDLKDAIEALQPAESRADKRALAQAEADAMMYLNRELDFTAQSIAALRDAYVKASQIMNKADATQDEVDAATKAVYDAIEALEEKPDFLFDDVKDPGKFYFDPVYWAYYADPQITNGVDKTHFGPDNACTRGHVVTFLWRAAGCPEPKSSTTPFKDLKKGAFYEKAVAWAVENEITNGMSVDKFAPDAECNRGQIVTFLWRFKGKPDPKSAETPFKDLKEGAFYLKAVAWAVENEITNGMSADKFAPDNTCTRGQVVTFLYRATSD